MASTANVTTTARAHQPSPPPVTRQNSGSSPTGIAGDGASTLSSARGEGVRASRKEQSQPTAEVGDLPEALSGNTELTDEDKAVVMRLAKDSLAIISEAYSFKNKIKVAQDSVRHHGLWNTLTGQGLQQEIADAKAQVKAKLEELQNGPEIEKLKEDGKGLSAILYLIKNHDLRQQTRPLFKEHSEEFFTDEKEAELKAEYNLHKDGYNRQIKELLKYFNAELTKKGKTQVKDHIHFATVKRSLEREEEGYKSFKTTCDFVLKRLEPLDS